MRGPLPDGRGSVSRLVQLPTLSRNGEIVCEKCKGRSLTVAVLSGLSKGCSKIQNPDREGAARTSQYFTQSEGPVRRGRIYPARIISICGPPKVAHPTSDVLN